MTTLRERIEEDRLKQEIADAKDAEYDKWRQRMMVNPNLDEEDRWRQAVLFRSAGHAEDTDATPKTAPALEQSVEARTADDIIAERAKTHGDFAENARVAQTIRYAMRDALGWSYLNLEQREALDHIAGKIARAVSGKGLHADHFTDIGGYARLGELATMQRVKQ